MSVTLPGALCPIETDPDKLVWGSAIPYSGSVRTALQATKLLRGALWSSRCGAPLWAVRVSEISFEWMGYYDAREIERLLRHLLDRPEELASVKVLVSLGQPLLPYLRSSGAIRCFTDPVLDRGAP